MFEPAVSPRKFGIKLFSVNKDQSPEKVTSKKNLSTNFGFSFEAIS